MKAIFNTWKATPTFFWAILFIVLNFLVTQDGEKNPMSRFAALRAITEQGTFKIDDYKDWTIDWSQTPDGHYYSNKAPGSILLVVPIFWALDKVSLLWEKNNFDERGLRKAPGYFHKTALSFLTQILPLIIFLFYSTQFLVARGISKGAIHFSTLALLFGNTAILFFNNWFGHGFAALWFLLAIWFLYRKQYFYFGMAEGFTILSEYSAALTLVPLLLFVIWQERKLFLRAVYYIFLGALPALVLWCWYHYSCFGSPLAIATQYYNPAFVDVKDAKDNLYGVMTLWPSFHKIFLLLFGPERGILFTQPWLLLLAIVGFFYQRTGFIFMLLVSLLIAIYMNAMVGSWEGGYSAGPRYICYLFLALAWYSAFTYEAMPQQWKNFFWLSLGIAILFRSFVYATTILIPSVALWTWMAEKFLYSGTPWLRFSIFWILFSWATRKTLLRAQAG